MPKLIARTSLVQLNSNAEYFLIEGKHWFSFPFLP